MLRFLFAIIDLYFLISAIIAQIFNPIPELIIPIRIPTKEAKAEMETHPITVETDISNCSIQLEILQPFLCFFS